MHEREQNVNLNVPEHIHIHLHGDFGSSNNQVVAALDKLGLSIDEMRNAIMAELSDLTAAVAANRTVTGSAVALLEGLTAKIQELIDNATQLTELKSGLQTVVDEVNADSTDLGNAVLANTPASATEPPVEPPVE